LGKYTKRSPKFFENIREINGIKERRCTTCGEWFPETIEYFYMCNKSKPEKGFQASCKKCEIKKNSKHQKENYDQKRIYFHENYLEKKDYYFENAYRYRENNFEKNQEDQRKWRQKNPEKCKYHASKHRNHDVTKKEWQACLKFFDFKCAYCGMTLKEHKNKYMEQLHKEHVDDDGYNDIRNCVPGCKSCNSSKHESSLEEWYLKQEYYSEECINKIIMWITEEYKKYIEPKLPYKIKRKKIYNEENTYYWEYQLWVYDEKRNLVDCIITSRNKEDLKIHIESLI